MRALRAAELLPAGMEGTRAIHEAIREATRDAISEHGKEVTVTYAAGLPLNATTPPARALTPRGLRGKTFAARSSALDGSNSAAGAGGTREIDRIF
jgi:hypothetical protein